MWRKIKCLGHLEKAVQYYLDYLEMRERLCGERPAGGEDGELELTALALATKALRGS